MTIKALMTAGYAWCLFLVLGQAIDRGLKHVIYFLSGARGLWSAFVRSYFLLKIVIEGALVAASVGGGHCIAPYEIVRNFVVSNHGSDKG